MHHYHSQRYLTILKVKKLILLLYHHLLSFSINSLYNRLLNPALFNDIYFFHTV